ncbi:MAG TPA: HAD-IA family hydrolase [Bryobacteraceae bacterium]|nr:HAD-IA family hydrolase [Bryobacteraceae bacterium]
MIVGGIAAVIFDMDGVLIDSNPTHAAAWTEYLAAQQLPSAGIDTWMAGKRNDQIMRVLLGEGAAEEAIFAHGAAKEALFRQRMAPQLEDRLMPGLRLFLDDLAGLPVGLGSNAEPANVDFLLDAAGLRHRFQAIVDGHQVELPKPAPDIYLRVAALLGVEPVDCLIFEDSPSGIRAARAAGARVVGVNGNGEPLQDVDLTIRNFLDPSLREWMARLQPRIRSGRL